MQSLKQLYKVGRGPSSSHTMAPEKVVKEIKQKYKTATNAKVVLYGSLASTGKGHMTDKVIMETFLPIPCEIEFNETETNIKHPNTMDFFVYENNKQLAYIRAYSIGGGSVDYEGQNFAPEIEVYPHKNFSEIKEYCNLLKIRLWQYAEMFDDDILKYLEGVWNVMKDCIDRGLKDSGVLEGGLNLQKKAKYLFQQYVLNEKTETTENRLICAYAFACSEQNASCGKVVTAPTCGSCGVLPAVFKYLQDKNNIPDREIAKALATAGIIGNVVKTNASISGAECGCQAEVGVAVAMASSGIAEISGMSLDQIEYSAEVALEHHLGLTCDPVCGLVQIPCIERNAVGALRALNESTIATFLSDTRKISFDLIVETMYQTGKDLNCKYRETAEGGIAKLYSEDKN